MKAIALATFITIITASCTLLAFAADGVVSLRAASEANVALLLPGYVVLAWLRQRRPRR